MYEVLDKDTIKFEILPHLSVAKRGYVSKSDLLEVIQCILYKLKNRLSMAHASCLIRLHKEGVAL